MVRNRAGGNRSAEDNSEDRDNRPSSRRRSSKIRNNAICNAGSAFRLPEALFDLYIDTNRSVQIAQPANREVSVHVVFPLNDLLLVRAHIRNISDVQLTRTLSLNGDPSLIVLI